jgi:GT2 family glycosyltransferase
VSITLIIVNWNSGGLLKKCLENIAHQTRVPDKILVIDNSSDDGSIEEIVKTDDISVRILDTNVGFAAANNLALRECDTEFVGLLNPDAFPEPDWLKNLLSMAREFPDISMFGSRQMSYESPDIVDGIGDTYHFTGLAWRDRHACKLSDTDRTAKEIFSPCAAAALYRRNALEQVGGFDEDYFCYMEDVDLGFRLRVVGNKAIYVPDAIVRHIGSATTGGQHSDFSVYHGHRNLVWTYVKNMPGVLFWLLLPCHTLMNMFTIVWFVLRGQGGVICKAKWDAIKGIPRMWRKRKGIQLNRTASIRDIWRLMDKRLIPETVNKSV